MKHPGVFEFQGGNSLAVHHHAVGEIEQAGEDLDPGFGEHLPEDQLGCAE